VLLVVQQPAQSRVARAADRPAAAGGEDGDAVVAIVELGRGPGDRVSHNAERAGFSDVDVVTLPLTWSDKRLFCWVTESPDAVFAAVSRGGVRTAAVLRGQTPGALEQIRAAVRRGVEAYWSKDGTFAVPMLMVLASGAKT